MRIVPFPRRLLVLSIIGLTTLGCASKTQMVAMRSGQGEAMPVIHIAPGYVERIALMDRYRLHDEERKHMMAKPRVWVEEVTEEEASSPEDKDDTVSNASGDPRP